MQELWRKTIEFSWRHPTLWLPYIFAELLAVFLWRLRGVAEKGIFDRQSIEYIRAVIAYIPLGFGTEFVIVCLFVVALTLTAKMVGMILEGQKPKLFFALKEIAPLWARILLFSFKFLVVFLAFFVADLALVFAVMRVMHRSDLPTSEISVFVEVLVVLGCTAWLLTPAAIRLLRISNTTSVSRNSWKWGAISAILAVAAATALGDVVQGLESRMMLTSQFERTCVLAVNKVVVNGPYLLFFVAISFIAFRTERGSEIGAEL